MEQPEENEQLDTIIDKLTDITFERSPKDCANYTSWFLSLTERKDENIIEKYKNVKPLDLGDQVTVALEKLFATKEVHLYLPWWEEDNTKRRPNDWYHIRFSTKIGGPRMFAYPYNPIVVWRESNKENIAIIHDGKLLQKEELPHFLDLLEELATEPKEFFDRVGKRWGHCLCCRRELTNDKSLERSIGPVCYKRVKELDKFMREVKEKTMIRKEEGGTIVPTAYNLNPVERKGIAALSRLYLSALECGLTFEPDHGVVFEPKKANNTKLAVLEEVFIPKLERYNHTRMVGRAKKECALLKIVTCHAKRETVVSMLLQYGCMWDEEKDEITILRSDLKLLDKHFEVIRGKKEDKKKSPSNLLKIEEINEKMYVGGNTFPHRGELKSKGCVWDPKLKAWEIPVGKHEELEALVETINNQ